MEAALKLAVTLGKYAKAKTITNEIQEILRPAGQETRLMQAKNRLFEAAMEAGDVDFAILGFEGVRKKVSRNTRLYLEATALLAICHLRKRDLRKAEPLMSEAINCDKNIRSVDRRREFRGYVIERFEEEGMIAALENVGSDSLDPEQIYGAAIEVLRTNSKHAIFGLLAEATPLHVVQYLQSIDAIAQKQLPAREVRLLANPVTDPNKPKLGKRIFSSLNA